MSDGLFSSFDGYRTPLASEYSEAFASGLVIPDANVLLNLYRYNTEAAKAVMAVFQGLRERLWIPHQVLREFWKHRESSIRAPEEFSARAVSELEKAENQVQTTIMTWARRVAAQNAIEELGENLATLIQEMCTAIEARTDNVAEKAARDTNEDELLDELRRLFDGRVGPAFSPEDEAKEKREASRRSSSKIPPGYKDSGKQDGGFGDYFVWKQILDQAKVVSPPYVVFVTADQKEDWWRKEKGENRGPRVELAQELRNHANARLLLLRPETLLQRAQEFLDSDLSEAVVRDVERVDRASSGTPWSKELVELALTRVGRGDPIKAQAFYEAVRNAGTISRARVYEIGDFSEDRTLRGFTRPFLRIVRNMRARGELDSDSSELFESEYGALDNPSKASSFRVPDEVINALNREVL